MRSAIVVGVGVALLATWAGWIRYRVRAFDTAYSMVARGTSEEDVRRVMGTPEQMEAGAVDVAFWEYEVLGVEVAGRVVKRYRYVVHTPYLGIAWTVDFDGEGRVVSKHRWD